ncbi:hypothetical protein TL16_g00739 [Triparma laevis f. inornata]|uniref:Uncharacterized protein n=1 Tax=Triparma laevis f. inornata TaxID=1714386 RepID=A0A9W6ZFT6_9STRA|nr:hypothetical protein TL16_g00739 [Triparma laevis f. inornata]
MPPAHTPSSPPPQIPFTLRECHTLRLPSESTCFGNLRVCLRTESGKSSPFVALSSSNHASFELVKSRKTPYKIIQSGEERSANRSAKSKARERNLERKKKQNADSNGELNTKESSSDNNSKKDASKDEETHNATDGCLEELIVSTDVIGGDGENWEDWSDPNSTAVEAVAVRRQTGSKVSYTLRISRRHHQGRERRKGKAAKAESEKKEDQEQNQETPVPTLQDAPTSTSTPNPNDSLLPEEPSNQTIDLNYAPLVLHLTYLPRNYVKTLTLLVSSNDSSSIRIYQPLNNNLGEFTEITDSHEKNKILPRMTDTFPSPILTLDSTFNLSTSSTYEYHAIVGCKNGYIRVISFNPQKNTEKFGNFYVDGPVSTVQVRGEGGG